MRYKEQQDAIYASQAPAVENPGKYLSRLYEDIDKALNRSELSHAAEQSGTTATTAYIDQNGMITTANLGDSRATLFVYNEETGQVRSTQLTCDHEPDDLLEQQRIIAAGGFVENRRLEGVLAISRAFGDTGLTGISSEPDIANYRLSDLIDPNERAFLCVDCDGAHERVDPSEREAVVQQMVESGQEQHIARALTQLAIDSGSSDNISVAAMEASANMDHPLVIGVFDGHGQHGAAISQSVADTMHAHITQDIEQQLSHNHNHNHNQHRHQDNGGPESSLLERFKSALSTKSYEQDVLAELMVKHKFGGSVLSPVLRDGDEKMFFHTVNGLGIERVAQGLNLSPDHIIADGRNGQRHMEIDADAIHFAKAQYVADLVLEAGSGDLQDIEMDYQDKRFSFDVPDTFSRDVIARHLGLDKQDIARFGSDKDGVATLVIPEDKIVRGMAQKHNIDLSGQQQARAAGCTVQHRPGR